jgi:hypothetical protein
LIIIIFAILAEKTANVVVQKTAIVAEVANGGNFHIIVRVKREIDHRVSISGCW